MITRRSLSIITPSLALELSRPTILEKLSKIIFAPYFTKSNCLGSALNIFFVDFYFEILKINYFMLHYFNFKSQHHKHSVFETVFRVTQDARKRSSRIRNGTSKSSSGKSWFCLQHPFLDSTLPSKHPSVFSFHNYFLIIRFLFE